MAPNIDSLIVQNQDTFQTSSKSGPLPVSTQNIGVMSVKIVHFCDFQQLDRIFKNHVCWRPWNCLSPSWF